MMARVFDIALTSDVVLLNGPVENRKLLLIRRRNAPFAGSWALPGGFLEANEDLVDGAARELEEETGVRGIPLHQIGAFGKPGRDPRGRVVSIAFWAFLPDAQLVQVSAADDAAEAAWFPVDELPSLAFDHGEIIAAALHLAG